VLRYETLRSLVDRALSPPIRGVPLGGEADACRIGVLRGGARGRIFWGDAGRSYELRLEEG
jgi:hypothetical protein